MARIKNTNVYVFDNVPEPSSFLVGSDQGDARITKSYRIDTVFGLLPSYGYFTDAPADGQPYLRQDNAWVSVPPSGVGSVFSVFGRTGAVTGQQADYDAFYSLLGHTHTEAEIIDLKAYLLPVDIGSTVQAWSAALDAVSGINTGDQTSIVGITGTKAQFNTALTDGNFMFIGDAPTAHTHTESDITDLQDYLLAADIDTLAELNTILTDATLIDTTDTRLSDARTPLAHTHLEADITDLQDYLLSVDISDINTTSGTPSASTWLRGDGVWGTILAGVSSVFGRTADVVAIEEDYDDFYSLLGHTHPISDVTGLQSALDDRLIDPITLTEMVSPSSPATDKLTVFAQDRNGKTTLRAKDSTGFEFQLGRDNLVIVRNVTGVTIPKGSAVVSSGATGATANIQLAQSNDPDKLPSIGITLEDIINNGFGYVMAFGILNTDTSAFLEGDSLYVSPTTAGGFTSVKPVYPNHVQRLGIVLVSGVGNGKIEVDTQSVIDNDKYSRTFLDTALDGKVSKSGDTMTGTLTLNSASNIGLLNGDNTQRLLIGGGSNWSGTSGAYAIFQGLDYGGVGAGGNIYFNLPSGKNLFINNQIAWHAGNLTPSDYVLKSGDTMTGNLTVPNLIANSQVNVINTIIRDNGTGATVISQNAASGNIYLRPEGNGSSAWEVRLSSGVFTVDGNTIWHSGNDGSGSGLDADTLDGYQVTTVGNRWGVMPEVRTDGVMEAGKYIDFHNSDTTTADNDGRLTLTGNNSWSFNGTLEASNNFTVVGASSPNIELQNTNYSDGGFIINRTNYSQKWKWWAQSSTMYFSLDTGAGYSNKMTLNSAGSLTTQDITGTSSLSTGDSITNGTFNIGKSDGAAINCSWDANYWRQRRSGVGTMLGWKWGNFGTDAATLLTNGKLYLNAIGRNLHEQGYLEGGHNNIGSTASKSNPIYVIGSSFVPSDAALGNMYGIGYSEGANATFLNTTDLGTNPSGWGMYLAADGNARLFFDATGGRSFQLGVAYASNFILNSDERRKNSIEDYDPSSLHVKWKSFELNTEEGVYRVGVIAQELLKTNPEFVDQNDPESLTVKYIDLLCAKMAEKDKQIEDLQIRLDRLEMIVKELL